MRYPLEKYKYYTYINENGSQEIAAVSTYGGKYVKGVAKCNPTDSYELEKGKKLAATRCNFKVASKRLKLAASRKAEAKIALDKAISYYDKMSNFLTKATNEYVEAKEDLNKLIDSLK